MATLSYTDTEETIAELQEAINGMTAQLKGPMSDVERALLVADRSDFREQVAQLRTHLTSGAAR